MKIKRREETASKSKNSGVVARAETRGTTSEILISASPRDTRIFIIDISYGDKFKLIHRGSTADNLIDTYITTLYTV